MNEIKAMGVFAGDVARDLEEARESAQNAELRILRDIELTWIGGGDESPGWPVDPTNTTTH
jgi:hypothetical protein